MKKLALIIAAIMLISLASAFCVSADGTAAWDGTVATGFAGGNGNEGNPYQIATAGQWAYFSQYAPKNPGKYYRLTADITFNTGDATTWGEEFDGIDMTPYIVGSWYTPDGDPVIGDPGVDEAPFIGTFDGQGHTISGFYAKKSKGEGDTVALFGSTAYGANATVQNLVITNSYFEAEDGVAAACVGQAEGGKTTVKNIYVTDTVTVVSGNKYAGGVMAHLGQGKFDLPSVTIDSCVNAATVDASAAGNNGTSVGGILGNGNQKTVTVTNCLNMGDVSAYRYVGGIIGFGKADNSKNDAIKVTVQYCVNTGSIKATYTSSNNGKSCAIACFDSTERDSQTAEGCYYVSGTATYGVFEKAEGEGATAVSLVDLCRNTLPAELGSDKWVARGESNGAQTIFEICIPSALASFAPETTKYHDSYTIPSWLANYGSRSVFEISAAEQFKELAEFVNRKYGDFSGKTVKLTADLTFNEGNAETWGETAPENDMTKYIIGGWTYPFCGTFDGNGKTISGFYAKKTAGEGDTVAIIGCTAYGKTATVKNLVITNSYFESAEGTVAACVAQTEGGTTTIKGVYVSESVYVVSGNHYAGGILAHVGQGEFETPTAIIDGCVNAATITANGGKNGSSVGGILGNANGKIVKITNCLNMGNVIGYQYVSGIVGYGLPTKSAVEDITISECINAGVITARYTDSNSGKACAIVCFGDSAKEKLVAANCLYVKGTAPFGVYEKGDDGLSTKTVNAGSDLIGLNIPSFLLGNITEWTKRDGQIIVPTAVVEFAPASSYKGEEIVTEPVETDPETEPTTDPVTDPVTEAPETKKPVETKAPDTQSGGCGGFTVVATAILVAVAGFSTAIVIKQR